MKMKEWIKGYLDNPQEIFVGAFLQFPLVFVIEWWSLPVMVLNGLLWRLGGAQGGHKLFRRVGVPLVVCVATWLVFRDWGIFLALPFMVLANPFSYGKEAWLYKLMLKAHKGNEKKADIATRCTGYLWYWLVYHIALFARF